VQTVWGKFQNGVAMGPRHGENEIGIGGNPRGQLTRGEIGRVTTELLDARIPVLNRILNPLRMIEESRAA
jgi:hypothetical protein